MIHSSINFTASYGKFTRAAAAHVSHAGTKLLARGFWISMALILAAGTARAQSPSLQPEPGTSWQQQDGETNAGQSPGAAITRATVGPPAPEGAAGATVTPVVAPPTASAANAAGRPITRVSRRSGNLPREHGQVWDEYDITPYTSRVTSTAKPERAIVDWILRDTGTEVWFSEPLGVLSATRDTLRVYHTPEVQQIVSGIVDRFVHSQGQACTYRVRLVTVGNPNWRTTALRLMRPVSVQTPGIEAWLLTKENAALLADQLKKRTDFREHNSSALVIQNGQAATISLRSPTNFLRSVLFRPGTWPGYEMQTGQVEEGFSLELSPLKSLDGETIDAVIKCQVDQVEKMLPVAIDVPQVNQAQRVQIQVPQMVSWRLHERFRWPDKEVLLISAGVVARPDTGRATAAVRLPNPFNLAAPRADGLMFVESLGPTAVAQDDSPPEIRTGAIDARGRY